MSYSRGLKSWRFTKKLEDRGSIPLVGREKYHSKIKPPTVSPCNKFLPPLRNDANRKGTKRAVVNLRVHPNLEFTARALINKQTAEQWE
jgi:hypothetical protein